MGSKEKEEALTSRPPPDEQQLEVSLRPKRLVEFIGQQKVKDSLAVAIEGAKTRGEVLDHILLCGPRGMGKTTLATIIANELEVAFQGTSCSVIENEKDLAAILSNVEKFQVLCIEEINRLNTRFEKLLYPAMEGYQIDYVVGRGPASRTIKLQLSPFTLIGTVPKQSDCSPDLLERFTVVLPFQDYSGDELQHITHSLALKLGVPSLANSVVSSIVGGCDGNPGRIRHLLSRLVKMGRGEITEDSAKRLMPLLGLHYQGDDSVGETPDVGRLSGIGFEELITRLLSRMGFRAEMTKASGDGGIDIIAELEKPIVGDRYLVQCKRLALDCLVGSPTVREFYGALTADRKAVKGILITTSSFTSQAREFAEGLSLELIDGSQLSRLFPEHGVLVNPHQRSLAP